MARIHGLITASVVALAASLAPASAQEAIHVAWYGGNWGDAFKACVADPFTKEGRADHRRRLDGWRGE